MTRDYTLFFDQISKDDLGLVGGKGANLGEMTKADFPVPYGFCVTTESYKEFIEQNSLSGYISDVIRDACLDNITEIGSRIRSVIKQSPIPESVVQEIRLALQKAGSSDYYAVRSSATAEDLAFASFAGQQDSYLNVKGEQAIVDAVRNCWASLFTDRAILYRIQNQIEHDKVTMSVVVQQMVLPDISGIMFTADPVSGHRGMLSIDAGYGLGEALVSGLVSPDVYTFRKKTNEIANKTIADKKLAIMPVEGGGTHKVEITGEKALSQVLTDAEIAELSQIGVNIETYYGSPQDIEWCLVRPGSSLSTGLVSGPSASQFFIVQSRPITSLFPMPYPQPQDDAFHVYFSFNHFQVMTDPISPLGIDMLRIIMPFDKGARCEEDNKHIPSAAGRLYIDISDLFQNKMIRKGLPAFLKNADQLLGKALIEVVNRPEFLANQIDSKNTVASLRRYLKPIIFKTMKNLFFTRPEGIIDFMNTYNQAQTAKAAESIQNAKPGLDRLNAIYETASFYQHFPHLLPRLAPGMVTFKLLDNLDTKMPGTGKYVDQIVKGLEGNITTEMGLLVGDLADMARRSPKLIEEFENEDYASLVTRINQLEGHEEFKQAFDSFMDIYDMRAAGEIDMAKDRWSENPEALAKSIMSTVRTSTDKAHRREYNQTIEQAKQAADELIKEVAAKHGRFKAKIVARLVNVMRSYLPAREHPKYLIMKLILIFKKAFLEEARLLVQKGHLTQEKDIFYVTFWELYRALERGESLIDLVAERKEQYRHFSKLTPPRVLTSEGEEVKASYSTENLPAGAMPGMPVSSGVIEGIAKVVTDPAQGTVAKGEILVAPFTDPGWTPLFINAVGLITEVGGLLTHGSVVAREYGIPAVVGISDATKIIKTGQKIRVDGDAGFVLVLAE